MRLMGLDIGNKTVGVAISDPLGYTAQPVETLRYDLPSSTYKQLLRFIEEKEITLLIVGLPLNMNGSEGPQAQKVKEFVKGLEDYLQSRNKAVSIKYWDERLSTVAAERSLLEADLSRAKRKKVIDKMAAVFILQGYLDSIQVKDT